MLYFPHLSKHHHAVMHKSVAVAIVALVSPDREGKYGVSLLWFNLKYVFV